MNRSRIVEVDYHEFLTNLRLATDAGAVIDPSDKQQWKAYVREHAVKEAACMSYARARGEKVKATIITDGGAWDGFYVYSPDEEFSLKYEPARSEDPE